MSIFEALLSPVTALAGKLIDGKISKRELAHELATLSEKQGQQIALAQIDVNKTEAMGKPFQRNWRPAIGWICALGLLYNVILHPILTLWFPLPPVDSSLLYPVMTSLLGLGALRTYEKTKIN